ncbi:LacI family DNA-binding transcriptional regulator [Streptomyces sp. WAC06614]|uniref:LacI family DNA-binding transcriptional regulator n=1 Tax=Streptomyces sp. WAC06614 TaxID=2487416 RepID=UPI000F770571|nr:substrate-binding domain-containing protein [Streptomyces sp. WAC06614]RSS78831.1 DeoR family transcriptional regulator [Streptomyces sp. WAC06614]
MRRHVDQRRARVLALVQERGSVRVTDLARELGISPVTLRRDIEAMTARGEIGRLHGSITRAPAPAPAPAWQAEPGGPVGSLGAAGRTGPAGWGAGLVVGMVVPTTDYYYADVVRGAREVVEACGARLTVGLTQYLPGEDRTQTHRLLSTGAHGLLLTPTWEDGCPGPGEGTWTTGLPVPTVLVERWAPPGHPAAELDRVSSDHAHGAARAVRHLAAQGHRRIALASRRTPTSARLRAGYDAAVAALGLPSAPPLPAPAPGPGPEGEADRLARTLHHLCAAVTEGGVTAALIHSDTDALVLIPRLQARGVRVPEDLTVITYDDEVAALAGVPLSAVAPPKREVGARAAELLLDRLTAATGRDTGPGGGRGAGPGRRGPGTRGGTLSPARQHVTLLPHLTIRTQGGPAK